MWFASLYLFGYAQAAISVEPLFYLLAGPSSEVQKGILLLRFAGKVNEDDLCRLLPERMEDDDLEDMLRQAYRLAYAILGYEDDAHDCVLKAISDVVQWDHVPRDVRAYFLRTVRNRAYDMLRRRKVEQQHRATVNAADLDRIYDTVSAADQNPYQQLAMREANEAVAFEVSKLPADTRDATIKYYFEGLDIETIAEHLHIPIGTVKSRLSRARRQLEKSLRVYSFDT